MPEAELKNRAESIQSTNHALLARGGAALLEMLDAIKQAKAAGAKEADLRPALELQRKAQWRLDFVSSENSMGFHAPPEVARILAESIDYSRQAQVSAQRVLLRPGVHLLPGPDGAIDFQGGPFPERFPIALGA